MVLKIPISACFVASENCGGEPSWMEEELAEGDDVVVTLINRAAALPFCCCEAGVTESMCTRADKKTSPYALVLTRPCHTSNVDININNKGN